MGARKSIMAFWMIVGAAKGGFFVNKDFKREFRTKQTLINFAKSKGLEIVEIQKFDDLGQILDEQTIDL